MQGIDDPQGHTVILGLLSIRGQIVVVVVVVVEPEVEQKIYQELTQTVLVPG